MFELIRRSVFYKIYKKFRSRYASIVNWNPSWDMFVIWVTWTDWKTTTCNIIHSIVNNNLGKAVLISTSNIKIWEDDIKNDTKMSSLDPLFLHKYLNLAKNSWCKYAILEVTSHWIDQFRFSDIIFDIWVLTNITAEHLDYHKTLENYANTKRKLFESIIRNVKHTKGAVLPKDSEYWRKWSEDLPFDKFLDYWVFTYASVRWIDINEQYNCTEFNLVYLWKQFPVKTLLLWEFNVQNICAAVSVWILMWIWVESIIKTIESFEWVDGRQDFVENGGVKYYIDFAHTPNWLEKVLTFLRKIKWEWRLITVFWAPWNRDKYKRPKMWKIVDTYSDYVIVTDDDPDTEDRYEIVKQIISWINRKEWDRFYILPQREHAIDMAVEIAKEWDIVLLAWKGHETVQVTNFWKRKWNDKDYLESVLKVNETNG